MRSPVDTDKVPAPLCAKGELRASLCAETSRGRRYYYIAEDRARSWRNCIVISRYDSSTDNSSNNSILLRTIGRKRRDRGGWIPFPGG